MHVAGKAVYLVAVQNGMRNDGKPLDELIAKRRYLLHVFCQVVGGFFERGGKPNGARNVLRTGAFALFLRAALDQVGEQGALFGVQHAHPLGTVELVRGEGKHIDVHHGDVHRQVPDRLHRVGVEQNLSFTTDGAYFRNRKHRADLIVGGHGGHQTSVLTDGFRNLLRGDVALLAYGKVGDFKALLFQLAQSVQYGVMFKGCGDDVLLALARADDACGKDGLVVRFASARGEIDLAGSGAEAAGYAFARRLQNFLCPLPHRVKAGRVAVHFAKIRKHRVNGGLAHFCGGRIVQIYLHNSTSFENLPHYSTTNLPCQ